MYAYAGNNPASYTDPFGLAACLPDDYICKGLVLGLREMARLAETEESRAAFLNAAKILDDWTGGRVRLVRSSEIPSGRDPDRWPGVITWGLAPNAASNPDGNLYVATDQPAGDFMLTVVHETVHMSGVIGHPASLEETMLAAFRGMPAYYRERSPGHLSGQRVGFPRP